MFELCGVGRRMWLLLVLLTVANLFVWLPHGPNRHTRSSRPTPGIGKARSIGLQASLVACVNCSTTQLDWETMTVLRGLRRVPQAPLGAEDVWAYTDLHRDTYVSNDWPKIAIIVMTSAERREQRKAIRETWGLESSYPNRMVRIVFFMNMLLGKRVSNQIEAEAKEYDDLVVQPVGSPSSQSSMVTEWVPEYMPSTPLVLVLRRDDCFVNVAALLANIERLTNGRFGVAGRRTANSSNVVDGKAQGSTNREDTVTSDVEDTVVDGQLRRHSQDDGVLVNSTEHRLLDLAPFDPCVVLVRGSTAFLRLQPAWPWFNTNASTADDSFFSGRLALRAGATLAHLDAFGPCDGDRSSSTSTLLQSAFVTTHGISPADMRAMHKAMMQRARKMNASNETALLLAKWGKALTPLRIA